MSRLALFNLFALFFLSACAQQKKISIQQEEKIAFPGAEGFGKYTTGGRGGKVWIITSLNDKGPGSLREALTDMNSKIIVFALSGTIHLDKPLNINSNTTIAGQSAPGDGICIADYPVVLKGNNIIVRYLRFRMGDRNQKGGMIDKNGSDDAFGGIHNSNVVIDHCTMSWSTDEAFSVYGGDSTTLQWNLISEPLNYSYHFEAGDKDYENHGYGGIWGGAHLSAHHNLFAHCVSRTPRFDGNRNIKQELVDFTNNVIYNWGSNNVYAGEGGQYNISRNYYKYGPATKESVKFRVANPFKKEPQFLFGKWYINENYVDGSASVSKNNWLGVTMDKGDENDLAYAKAERFSVIDIKATTAEHAYQDVLAFAGASFRRDSLDARIVNDVKNRTGRIIDVQGGYAHGTPYEQTLNAWPALQSAPSPVDGDRDGMADEWEVKKGLNTKLNDAAGHELDKHYTNIEVYLNSLIK